MPTRDSASDTGGWSSWRPVACDYIHQQRIHLPSVVEEEMTVQLVESLIGGKMMHDETNGWNQTPQTLVDT